MEQSSLCRNKKTAALFESVGIDLNTLVTILNLAEKPDGFYPGQPEVQRIQKNLVISFKMLRYSRTYGP